MLEIIGLFEQGLKLGDFHIHTNTKPSDGKMTPSQVIDIAVEIGIDGVAVTDHNTIEGSLRAVEYAQKIGAGLDVITGIEVSTLDGHVLALGIKREIPKNRRVEETLEDIEDQGGVAIIAHPFYREDISLKGKINSIALDERWRGKVGIEVYNAGVSYRSEEANIWAESYFKNTWNGFIGATGGSDAHLFIIGAGLTGYKGDILECIRAKQTSVFALDFEEQRLLRGISIRRFGSWINELTKKYAQRVIREKERRLILAGS